MMNETEGDVTDTQREGHMKAEAETGIMQQVRNASSLDSPLESSKEMQP